MGKARYLSEKDLSKLLRQVLSDGPLGEKEILDSVREVELMAFNRSMLSAWQSGRIEVRGWDKDTSEIKWGTAKSVDMVKP